MNDKQTAESRFRAELERIVPNPEVDIVAPTYDDIVLDGRFTFEQMAAIMEAWRQYREECEPK